MLKGVHMAMQDMELQRLHDAIIDNVRIALWHELDEAADDILDDAFDGPDSRCLPISRQLMEANDWITMQQLFDEAAVEEIESREAHRYLYENLVRSFSDQAEDDMEEIFNWVES